MFKSARWRSDKNKVKAVFRLQFYATQVSSIGGDSLMVSVVPADVGKPTAKLEKSIVKDGCCYWGKPIYETVKLDRDSKTAKIHERIYKFVVSTGSPKVGLVGEVSIDFANYAVSTKLSSVSLPLKNAKSEAVLHVSIERMLDSVDQREVDEDDSAKLSSEDRSLRSQLSHGDTNGAIKSNSTEDGSSNKAFPHASELNANSRASSGSDATMSSCDSTSGLDKTTVDASTTIYEEHQWEWLGGSAPEVSTDDSSNSPRETLLREISQEDGSDNLVEKLKTELAVLARQANVSELELQTLRKQIVKESKRAQDLSRELVSLREERDSFKEKCEKLKAAKKCLDEAKITRDPLVLLEEIKEEINHEKELNANLRIQLQKTQESNTELILAVRDLDEMLEQKNRETLNLSNKSDTSESFGASRGTDSKCETDDDEDQRALEELVKEHSDDKEAYLLEQKIMDLHSEVESYRRDKDELEMQMEQLALDYEILKQENHDISYKLEQSQLQEQLKMQYECSTSYATLNELENQIESLEDELKKGSKEFSDSLVNIKELENHVKGLEEELENQAHGFEADLEELTRAKIEQEKRAILAEETLRKTRWQNANTAERIQEEFRRLSLQMASTFDANEKVATKAVSEARELRFEKTRLKEALEKAKEDLQLVRDQYEAKLLDLSSQLTLKMNQMEKLQSEIEDKSMEVENQRKQAEETHRVLSQEIERLRTEIERLTIERNGLWVQAEEKETLRAELEEKSLKEVNIMRGLKDEKESIICNLQMEMETHKARCDQMKHSLFEDGLEKEKLRKQVSQLKDLHSVNDVSEEVENLREKIRLLEGRIMLKETALETSTNSFSNKENDLRNKIEELEIRLETLNQNATKVTTDTEDLTLNGRRTVEVRSRAENSRGVSNKNGCPMFLINSSRDKGDISELLKEMASLKERNKSMEGELNEMQERYSEISLKFAEVEGERQQLVMSLRNLKNAKKS